MLAIPKIRPNDKSELEPMCVLIPRLTSEVLTSLNISESFLGNAFDCMNEPRRQFMKEV